MQATELENKKTIDKSVMDEINKIEQWFRTEYVKRRMSIDRYAFLNISPKPETRLTLEVEAYNKEQRLRELKGLPLLPNIKTETLF